MTEHPALCINSFGQLKIFVSCRKYYTNPRTSLSRFRTLSSYSPLQTPQIKGFLEGA